MSGGQIIAALQRQLKSVGVEVSTSNFISHDLGSARTISTGCAAVDAWFPNGGLVRGSTIEIVSPSLAAGATHFTMMLAKQICGPQGLLVLIDRRQDLNPALLTALGFDLQNVLFVHPQSEEDHLWALEQALADTCVAAVWTRIEKLDKRYQRRWQLAAERGQSIGLLQRPEKVLGHPTWAMVQVQVRPHPHSHWLSGNQRAGHGRPENAGDGHQENWVIELTAQRGKGRFEHHSWNIELYNHSYAEWQVDVEGQETRSRDNVNRPTASSGPVFFGQRLPHPNDPWFTKTAAGSSRVPTEISETRSQANQP